MILAFIGSSNSGPSSDTKKNREEQSSLPYSQLNAESDDGVVIADNGNGAAKIVSNGVETPKLKSSSEHDKLKDERQTYRIVSSSHNVQCVEDEANLRQDSSQENTGSSKLLVMSELSPKEVLRSVRFWILWLFYLCTSHTSYVHQKVTKVVNLNVF